MAEADDKAAEQAKAEADAKAKAEADAKAQADAKTKADADAKAAAEAKAKAEAEAGPKTLDEARALIAELKAKADAGGNMPEWAQKRVDQITGKFRDEERKRVALEKQLEEARSGKPVTVSDDEINARAAALAADQEYDRKCRDVISAGKKAVPEFDSAVAKLHQISPALNAQNAPNMPRPFVEALIELDNAPRIIAELAKAENNDEAARIMAMPPSKQGVALAKFASKLTPLREVSKTPPPPDTLVNGRAKGEPSLDDGTLSMADWVALRNKQIADRRKARA